MYQSWATFFQDSIQSLSLKYQQREIFFNVWRVGQKLNELSTIFDTMPHGVLAILDPKLNIMTINKITSSMLGSDSHTVVGKNARKIFESRFPGILKIIEERFWYYEAGKLKRVNFTI